MKYTNDTETKEFIDKVANDCIANMTEDIKKELAIYQLVVDIFKFPRFFFPGLLMALA